MPYKRIHSTAGTRVKSLQGYHKCLMHWPDTYQTPRDRVLNILKTNYINSYGQYPVNQSTALLPLRCKQQHYIWNSWCRDKQRVVLVAAYIPAWARAATAACNYTRRTHRNHHHPSQASRPASWAKVNKRYDRGVTL